MSSINDQASDSDSDHGKVKRLAKQSLFEQKFLHLKDKNTSAIVCRINKQRVYQLSQGNKLKLHGL
jgi:hypothetical protein